MANNDAKCRKEPDMYPKYTNAPPFVLCPYGNNIWMHKFQQLIFQMLNLMLYILTPSPTQGHL